MSTVNVNVRVASRNRTLAHIPRFEKMADEVGATEMVFTGLPEGYQRSFWAGNFRIFIISSIAVKKDEPRCPLLSILAGSLVCITLTMMSSTESSLCSSPEPMDLSGCFSTPRPILVSPLAAAARTSGASGGSGVTLTI